jgi:hypothetical protein
VFQVRRGFAVLVLPAVLFLGCGGGGGRSSANFIAEANAICKAGEKKGRSASAPKTQAELNVFFERAQTLGQHELGRLKALEPPAENAQSFHVWIAGLEGTLAVLARAGAAARAGNLDSLRHVMREGNALAPRNRANARAAGLAVCADAS